MVLSQKTITIPSWSKIGHRYGLCSPQCDGDGGGGSHEGDALQVRDGNGGIFLDISFGGDYSCRPYVSTIFLHLS